MNRTRDAVRGFTLIEVLVALAIVAVGMAAVLGTLTSSADTLSYLRDKSFAQWVGLNQIANLRLSGQQTAPGNSDGDTDFGGRKWHWRQEVVATEIPGVVRIDVSVRPSEAKGDDQHGWFTTVSGIQGDAVGVPNGYQPDWGSQMLPGQAQIPGTSGTPGTIGSGQTNFGMQGSGSGSTLGGPSTLGGSSNLGGPPLTNPPPSTPQSDPDFPPDTQQEPPPQ